MASRLPDDDPGATSQKSQRSSSTEHVDRFEYCQANNGSKESEVEPIAIIGFSLKYPQEAISAESFWQMLCEGRDATSDFPPDRLNIDAFYDPDTSRHNTVRRIMVSFVPSIGTKSL